MDNTRPSRQPASPRSRSRKNTTDQEPRPAPEFLWLGAVEAWVEPYLCLGRPVLAQLVAEDACWRISTQYWCSRRPSRWRLKSRSGWKAEGRVLEQKKVRLKDQALLLGIRPAARPRTKR